MEYFSLVSDLKSWVKQLDFHTADITHAGLSEYETLLFNV